ncbi:hypothetical protein GE061_007933 [Apolygus lucorum]|uniref:Chitin-binding type-2 domain-containing protein n=1 Tax=Apolygus lucorum TaxID=248454 RepID=A0A8S9WQV4_APOLU|nr:hypothetical protein GE061_007933 [Apolygus lucorum]
MYWTHLIFALTLGLLCCYDSIRAVKAGYLDFDNLPETNFSCKNKVIGGYYADVETGCQMFHVCTIGQKGEVTDIKFLCLNGTVFDQETRVCERIDEVDCSKSEDFFNLNLELYGNQAGGIQPEEEFFCEDCSTEEDDYDLSSEVTTRSSTTTTTTTSTTTTPRPTTTVSTTAAPATPKVGQHYANNDPETIAALLALHNAFTQSVQNPKVKPPPPRVINNAFASLTPSTPKPSYYGRPQVTQLPPREDAYDEVDAEDQRVLQEDHRIHQDELRIRQESQRIHQEDHRIRQDDQRVRQDDQRVRQDDQRVRQEEHRYAPLGGHGALTSSTKERHKTNFYQVTTPANLKSNYHHFQSGDSTFLHSFDTGKQYNYQYFHPRKVPEPTAKASVSIVTSTSTSTSVRAVKPNGTTHVHDDPPVHIPTAPDDFPTGYDDYPDDSIDDAFFRDVPRIRTKRSSAEPRHANHKYPDDVNVETTTPKHHNHRYAGQPVRAARILSNEETPTRREQFLQNLLGSLDMEEHDRQKMARFFKVEENDMEDSAGLLHRLGNKLGELIMEDVNKTIHQAKIEQKNATDEIMDMAKINELWQHHYEEMSQEVDLKFELGTERDRRDAEKKEKLMEELAQDYELAKGKIDHMVSSVLDKVETKPDLQQNSTEVTRVKRQAKGLDTEKFAADHQPRRRAKTRLADRPTTRASLVAIKDVAPVFEEVDEGDFTTRPYLKTSDRTLRPRLTTRSVDSTASRPRFNYEITTPAVPPALRRRVQNQRSASLGERSPFIPRLGAVPNVTRDISKLKDVPVYEEEYDSGEMANVQVPYRQEPGPTARPLEFSQGQFPVHAFVSSPSTPSFPVPEYFPQETLDDVSPSTESVQYTTLTPQVSPNSQSTPSRSHSRRVSGRRRVQSPTRIEPTSRQTEDHSPRRASQDRRFLARQQLRTQQLETPSENERVFEVKTQAPPRTQAPLRKVPIQTFEDEYDGGEGPNVPVPFRPEYDKSSRVQESVDGQFPARSHLPPPSSSEQFPLSDHVPQDEAEVDIPTTEVAQITTHPSPPPPRKQVRVSGRSRSRGATRQDQSPRDEVNIPRRASDERIIQTRHRPRRPQTEVSEDVGSYEAKTQGSLRDHETVLENPEPAPPRRTLGTKLASRGSVRGTLRSTTPPNEPPPAPPMDPSLTPDPNFSCDGKIKGSFYADVSNDCKGFFICSQGQIDGPLLKSHFWCGTSTKFNQRSRTCQAEDLVQCEVSSRYYHLNQDFAIPETEEQLKPSFEPQRT